MKLLIPLGLLGLIGLVILLIIYLIKPNYQKKAVSSTYVWNLSLKYRKKRKPVSRMRDIILLIIQILTVALLAFIMAQPVLAAFRPAPVTQKIAIIDGSVSMLATPEGESETRFERAVSNVRALASEVVADNGEITVIIANDAPDFVTMRTTSRNIDELNAKLDELAVNPSKVCCHGGADIDGAMHLAERVLYDTPQADVLYYTGKSYIYKGDVEVVDVSDPTEYNVAILNSEALLIENYYNFNVEIESFGRPSDVTVTCEVYGVNGDENAQSTLRLQAYLESDVPQTIVFNGETTGTSGVYSYEYAYIYVGAEDSLYHDNTFYIYGGTKETVRIQYVSEIPNSFFRGNIMSLRETMRAFWNIEFVEVNPTIKKPETQGFDFYIYERATPASMPTDGVCMFVNSVYLPDGIGARLTDTVRAGNMFLTPIGDHPITSGLLPNQIFLSECRVMTLSDEYDVLLSCYRDPAFAIRNDNEYKIVIMPFELQNSDLPLLLEFPKIFFRTFNYFFPTTVTRYNFEVGESVEVNARADELVVSGQNVNLTITDFPSTFKLDNYGTYTLSQTLFNGNTVMENLYVKIPNSESDFTTVSESLANPYVETLPEAADYDLLLYFAGALVLLLLAERILHSCLQ